MLIALLVLTFIIIIHESGHCLTAKFFRMKVDTFSIGFGPALIKWKSQSTLYQICIIPLGGYVKIRGFTSMGENILCPEGGFSNFPRWQRAVVFAAGSGANLISVLLGSILAFWLYGYHPMDGGEFQKLSLPEAVKQGTSTTSWAVTETVKGIGSMFADKVDPKEGLAGPVGVVNITKDFQAKLGIEGLAIIAFLLSIGIALTNLLPVPVLDGGHLAILSIEAAIGRDLPAKVKVGAYAVGIVLLLVLMIFVSANDIGKLLSK